MPSRNSYSVSKRKLKDSGFFSSREIDTLITLPTLEAVLFLVKPFLPGAQEDPKEV